MYSSTAFPFTRPSSGPRRTLRNAIDWSGCGKIFLLQAISCFAADAPGCRQPISPQYPLVKSATALAALVLWKNVATSLSPLLTHDIFIGLQCGALLLMISIAVIDMRHYIIPDLVTVSLVVAALLVSFLPGDTTPLQSVIGAAVGGAALLCLGWLGTILFRKENALGGGDIKLMAAVGAINGYKIVLLTFFFGSCFGTSGPARYFSPDA